MGLDALLLEGGDWKTYSLVVIGMVTPSCEDVGPTTAWSMVIQWSFDKSIIERLFVVAARTNKYLDGRGCTNQ
eukprot:3295317-Heterocapsa_arctica.AAC.1